MGFRQLRARPETRDRILSCNVQRIRVRRVSCARMLYDCSSVQVAVIGKEQEIQVQVVSIA